MQTHQFIKTIFYSQLVPMPLKTAIFGANVFIFSFNLTAPSLISFLEKIEMILSNFATVEQEKKVLLYQIEFFTGSGRCPCEWFFLRCL